MCNFAYALACSWVLRAIMNGGLADELQNQACATHHTIGDIGAY